MPALMQAVEDLHRELRIQFRVGEFRPLGFLVRLDRWPVFGQSQPKADKRVHMTVGDVVHHLPRGPAAVTVWFVELCRGQRRLQLLWECTYGRDGRLPRVSIRGRVEFELAGRKSWVHRRMIA